MAILKSFISFIFVIFKFFPRNTQQAFFLWLSLLLTHSLTFCINMYNHHVFYLVFFYYYFHFKAQQEAFELLIAIKHYYMHKWWIAIIFSFAIKWKVPMGDLMTFVIVAIEKYIIYILYIKRVLFVIENRTWKYIKKIHKKNYEHGRFSLEFSSEYFQNFIIFSKRIKWK